MTLEYGDHIEYEVVSREGESTYFADEDEAVAFFRDKENDALLLNRVATETLLTAIDPEE